jgi:UDP-N-acetyl-2-amino-2-deoxyglucuronate dehydrogenase
MDRTRIAVVGLGMAVKHHARSLLDLADRVEVAGCFSPTEARRAAFASDWGLPVTGDLDGLIADPTVTAVMILTPPATHLELVERAAAAGKHILLEKPLEISTARAERLVAAADAAGVTLGVVFQNRFNPASLALEEMIAAGRLGELASASLRLRNWRPQGYYDEPGRGTRARDGGGVLITQAIHPINQLIAFAGQPAEVTAYATTSALHRMETEDLVAASLRYPGGALGTLSATTAAYPGFPTQIEIVGTLGTATLTDSTLAAAFQDGSTVEAGENATPGGAGADPMAFANDNHRALITDFLDAIRDGRAPKSSGRDALLAHDLIDALLAAAAAGSSQPVTQR